MNEVATPADGTTAGTLLREAREAAGMHVASLAALLKVPVPKLDALEQDRYDLLPDAVFVRALASSVCRTLKIDPQPVLQRLPQTGRPRLVQDTEHINAPFRSPNDGPTPGFLQQFSRPVVIAVLLLLLGAVVIVFLPYAQRGFDAVSQANSGPDPVMPPPGAAATVETAPVPVEPASAPGNAATSALPAQMPVSAAGPAPTAAALTPAPDANAAPGAAPAAGASPQPAAAAQSPASGPIGADGVVAFRTRAQSWVQVTDARGATVFRKLMEPGETASANGALPLSVTVGSAQGTEVEVRGKPYNLAPFSRDNVARFQVK